MSAGRSKVLYTEKLGFRVDNDLMSGPMRVVQLTPPGSNCSITIGPLIVDEVPESSAGYQLVVDDVEAARKQLLNRGVDVGEVTRFGPRGSSPATAGLQRVRLLQGSRRQQLGRPGDHEPANEGEAGETGSSPGSGEGRQELVLPRGHDLHS